MKYRELFILEVIKKNNGTIHIDNLVKDLYKIKSDYFDCIQYKGSLFNYTLSNDLKKLESNEYININDKVISYNKDRIAGIKILLEDIDLINRLDEFTFFKKFTNVYKYESSLFTIGYEGVSVENFFNKLLDHNVTHFIDTRKNAFSMKFGFSKNNLRVYCNDLNIKYIHYPELGVEKDNRHDKDFKDYKEHTLIDTIETQNKIKDMLTKGYNVALMCFEKDINTCHRLHLANNISKDVIHL